MAYNEGKTTKNVRRWTDNELELFAEVLADPKNNFAITLERVAPKKTSYNEYSGISKVPLR